MSKKELIFGVSAWRNVICAILKAFLHFLPSFPFSFTSSIQLFSSPSFLHSFLLYSPWLNRILLFILLVASLVAIIFRLTPHCVVRSWAPLYQKNFKRNITYDYKLITFILPPLSLSVVSYSNQLLLLFISMFGWHSLYSVTDNERRQERMKTINQELLLWGGFILLIS